MSTSLNDKQLARFKRIVQGYRDGAVEVHISRFKESLVEDPFSALVQARRVFEETAQNKVHMIITHQIPSGNLTLETLVKIRDSVYREAVRFARAPEFSTNPLSNFMSQCEGVVWASLCEPLDVFIEDCQATSAECSVVK